ncbi:hypothetical protein [Pseudoxanthomonas mexicana]|uniref:hypothetical protein n=1 Tax=Pseudoxanthomonas mexicana TaxID=128785 RepID=UPI0022F38C20|nr:hypothetical protein [Pseudoxanthomonas mexicana]WBX94977.1 hypothetical protein PE064_07275 [Pseudoxanthomonas mexicana]
MQNPKFETLLTAAADALIYDQTLQAIACLAAARERLYELAVRVLVRSKKIDESSFAEAWKDVSSQSERQLGAFLFLYLLATGKAFKIDKSLSQARNAALHKGEIPTTEKAFEFAEKTYLEVKDLADYLRAEHADALREVMHEENVRKAAKAPAGVRVGTIALNTIYGSVAEKSSATFKEAFDQYKAWLLELDGLVAGTQKHFAGSGPLSTKAPEP